MPKPVECEPLKKKMRRKQQCRKQIESVKIATEREKEETTHPVSIPNEFRDIVHTELGEHCSHFNRHLGGHDTCDRDTIGNAAIADVGTD